MRIKDLNNKTCWITGASSGIGASLALKLSKTGANLILSARDNIKLEEVKAECTDPSKVKIAPCDLENIDELPRLAAQVWDLFNCIDYVFLNAGFAVRDMITDIDLNLYDKVMKVNFLSAVTISKTLLPLMIERGWGAFIVTSSLSGKYGVPKLSAYSASKHALHGYFESLRAEYHDSGIQVTMIIPGLVKTNISVNALTGEGKSYGKMQKAIKNGISPEKCSKAIIKAAVKGKNEVVIGGSETISVAIKRLFPGFFTWMIRNHPLKKLRKIGFGS